MIGFFQNPFHKMVIIYHFIKCLVASFIIHTIILFDWKWLTMNFTARQSLVWPGILLWSMSMLTGPGKFRPGISVFPAFADEEGLSTQISTRLALTLSRYPSLRFELEDLVRQGMIVFLIATHTLKWWDLIFRDLCELTHAELGWRCSSLSQFFILFCVPFFNILWSVFYS